MCYGIEREGRDIPTQTTEDVSWHLTGGHVLRAFLKLEGLGVFIFAFVRKNLEGIHSASVFFAFLSQSPIWMVQEARGTYVQ